MDDFIIGAPPVPQNNSGSTKILSDIDPDKLFEHCWRRNACGSCLSTSLPCGWCPVSQTCVPATRGFLTPLSNPMVCPVATERFELRTKPLSCNVSTLTTLTALVSVSGTLLIVGTIYAIIKWRTQLWKLFEGVRESWRDCNGGNLDTSAVDENTSLLNPPRIAAEGLGRRWSYWAYNTAPGDGDGRERPGVGRSDTSGEESEGVRGGVGGEEFEERRRMMLQRSTAEV